LFELPKWRLATKVYAKTIESKSIAKSTLPTEITLKITALSYVSLKLKTCNTSMMGHFYPISIIQKYAIF
ncbi:MAG: hypothetical protein VX408_07690, partial [Pseudomonadota bacterium]|nr:hypothetical protein [Pseudomonadota bacterium]